MKAQHICKWLLIGSFEHCGRSCLGEHCKVHLARLRKGPGTQPCTGCGKGIKNSYKLCLRCGYHRLFSRDSMRRARTFRKEFARLAAIEIPFREKLNVRYTDQTPQHGYPNSKRSWAAVTETSTPKWVWTRCTTKEEGKKREGRTTRAWSISAPWKSNNNKLSEWAPSFIQSTN